MNRILRIALLVQSAGYWIIPLSMILAWCFSSLGHGGKVMGFLLLGPAGLLFCLSMMLAHLGFYALGVVIFAVAVNECFYRKERKFIILTLIYLLSAITGLVTLHLCLGEQNEPVNILKDTFIPWFR